KTIMYDAIRKKEFTLENFTEDTGYTKNQWLNAKCLLGDKSDNVPGVPGFGKAKVSKWLKGELTLTDEQEDIFTRNMTVFDLREVMHHDSEKEYYQQQLDVSIEPQWSQFVDLCKSNELENILKKKDQWHGAFVLSSKLLSMFR
ncbi:hypothetical protein N9273_00675, partial [bacterium]|nr:hypothetical protein [bacterium]